MNFRLWIALATAVLVLPACGGCNKPPTKDPVKPEGDPCATDIECETGLCFALKGDALKCRRKCTTGCKKEEVCTQVDLNRYGCVPAREGLCKACQTNADCPYAADICISVSGVKVCGRDCSFDNACPESYTCSPGKTFEGSDVLAQCQPTSGTCACTALSVGQQMTCENTNDAGTCLGSRTCMTAGYTQCTALVPLPEVCNGKDDNCNMQVDENLGETSCGVGECKRVFANCVNGMPQSCVQGAPSIDICNEKDDDCDGVIDNNIDKNSLMFCGSCTNSCAAANGTPKCTTGTCAIDTCTAPFKDCDGVYSNGCEANTGTSLLHCGACAKPCTAANATPMCTTGMCTFTCLNGFGDIDKNPANGCEATCTTTDAPDLMFQDTNCDGIDGIEANGIFVDTLGGLSGNPGSKALPKKTITEGIAAAQAQGKNSVFVSQGIYSETVTLVGGISLYGSYNGSAGWSRAISNLTLILSSASVGVRGSNLSLPTTVQLFSINSAAATGAGNSSIGVFITDSPGGVTLTNLTVSNGNGSAGLDGSNGNIPSQGGQGGDAPGRPTRGSSGFSACGASGGFGGTGVSGTTGGQQGDTGLQAPGGGVGATGGNPGSGGSCSLTSATNGGAAPAVGSNGQPGNGGIGGTASAPIGALNAASLYLPSVGGAGGNGTPGGGGGGGGSGGGTQHGSGFLCTGCSNNTSGGGGGGGGGGCGGFGGLGGRGGGGSFAIATINSVVTIDGSKLTTGNGGKGGDGGDGSTGAIGGQGGSGAPGEATTSCSDKTAGSGANGSSGGQGGRGGGGAGGPGGPSICVFYKGAAPNTSNLNCTTGTPGAGGTGGSGFQSAQNGPTGQSGTVLASN